jgi:2-oxoglutarate dehydrogenase E2 component (dihydrolipoamide succinyltransferase)
MIDIVVPHLGESIQEATLSKWIKNIGDDVNPNLPIAELETEKITLDIFPSVDGVLIEQCVKEGEKVSVNAVIGKIKKSLLVTNTQQEEKKPLKDPVLTPNQTQETSNESELSTNRLTKRIPLTPLRQSVAKRLKESQNQAATLTTFNEIDMSAVQGIRRTYHERFLQKHGVKLGLMSFFVKAIIFALKEIPSLNAHIEDDCIVSKNFYDINVAISSSRGLVTPTIFDADEMDFPEIEKKILEFSEKITNHTLTIEDLKGGTFTITNGGVFGSLLSTPILNAKQSGILGLHKIQDRPVVVQGSIVIRPMMYVALSYDHRIVDGKEAITFLEHIKNYVEYPERVM